MKTAGSTKRGTIRPAITAFIALILLTSCGGRVSRPVDVTTGYDDRLSCDHLHAERRVNDARIADLRDEKTQSQINNLGVGLLFLDVSPTERNEITALENRNKVLDGLLASKCTTAGAASD
jgi:hypothetical protein